MKHAIVCTMLWLMMVVVGTAQRSFKLVAPDQRFQVSFPGEPRHQQNVTDSGQVHIEAHSYSFETSASKFVLTYVHLSPPPVDLRATDAIDSAIGGTLGNLKGKLLAQRAISFRGNPAKVVIIGLGENTIIDGRFVYVRPRVYQLLVLHRKGATPPFEQQFFDSFFVTN